MKMVQRLIFNLLLAAAMTFALPAVAQAGGGVAEQFNLAPGGTYYFDLSDENIPGTFNPNLPDPSLRWVPFTYVGTINAYSLGPESSGDIFASDNAAVSDRSLFVAEHGVTGGETWDAYNAAGLIFGKDYQSGGVSYKLRSLSAGNRQRDGYQSGLPESNEWDRILEKNAGYIKNWYNKKWFTLEGKYDYVIPGVRIRIIGCMSLSLPTTPQSARSAGFTRPATFGMILLAVLIPGIPFPVVIIYFVPPLKSDPTPQPC